jgi:hypothetical protein
MVWECIYIWGPSCIYMGTLLYIYGDLVVYIWGPSCIYMGTFLYSVYGVYCVYCVRVLLGYPSTRKYTYIRLLFCSCPYTYICITYVAPPINMLGPESHFCGPESHPSSPFSNQVPGKHGPSEPQFSTPPLLLKSLNEFYMLGPQSHLFGPESHPSTPFFNQVWVFLWFAKG